MIKIIAQSELDDPETREARDLLTNDLIKWEHALKSAVLPCKRFTLVTHAVTAEPDRRELTVCLKDMFPILKFARASNAKLSVPSVVHGDSRIDIVESIELLRYGSVMFIGASVDDNVQSRDESDMRFNANGLGGVSLSLINNGYITNRHLHYITLAVPNEVCLFCKGSIKKRYKCSRCWTELRFPVHYCCKRCQVADFPAHRVCCGVKYLRQ